MYGWKRYETLHEYCNMFSYLQAGEDDHRFPTEPSTLEAAKEAFRHLEDLVVSYRQMQDGKELQKVANTAAAKKMAKKDSDGLALERYVFCYPLLLVLLLLLHPDVAASISFYLTQPCQAVQVGNDDGSQQTTHGRGSGGRRTR